MGLTRCSPNIQQDWFANANPVTLGKVHCLAYKVAAWQRDLDTPPWKWEEEKKDSHLQTRSFTLGYHQLVHENTGGKTKCQCCIRIQSPAWTVSMHTQATSKQKCQKLPDIDWLVIQTSRGGKEEVDQDLNTDSYLHKRCWNTATKSGGLKIQGVFLWLSSVFILMNKPYD